MEYNKVILISLDTFRGDLLSSNPNKFYEKNHKIKVKLKESGLDTLCSKGFLFNNVVVAAPNTSASHAAFFTGRWPKYNGIYDHVNSKLKIPTIFSIAVKNSYNTIFKTDFPIVLGKHLNFLDGVNRYYIEDDDSALKEIAESEKLFAFFHFGQIHHPYGFHNLRYGGVDYKNKVNELEEKYKFKADCENLDNVMLLSYRSEEDKEYYYRYNGIIRHLYRNELYDDLFELYVEGVSYFFENKLDSFLNRLMEILENERYLIIIFSDHGEEWSPDAYGHFNTLDEAVIRVPLIFYGYNIRSGLYQNRIRSIDLVPTINDLCFKEEQEFDGESLSEIIFSKKIENDRFSFATVWINNSRVKNARSIINNDGFEYDPSASVKYSACVYENDYKYIEQYKKFFIRLGTFLDREKGVLLKYNGYDDAVFIENNEVQAKLRRRLVEFNNVINE